VPGPHPEDVNGNMLVMRVEDDNGEWRISEKDARLMGPRAPDEADPDATYYRLHREGTFKDYDGFGRKIARPPRSGYEPPVPLPLADRGRAGGCGSLPATRARGAGAGRFPARPRERLRRAHLAPRGSEQSSDLPSPNLLRCVHRSQRRSRALLRRFVDLGLGHEFIAVWCYEASQASWQTGHVVKETIERPFGAEVTALPG
jgi:hypothetical protein